MRTLSRQTAALCAVVSALAGHAAGAQITDAATANGCFGLLCTPAASGSYQAGVTAGGGLLQYHNAVFAGTAVGGALALGGTPVAGALNANNFGSFSLGTL